MITLRPATLADAAMLLDWRNDPGTLAGSLSTEAVLVDQHLGWLREVLGDPERQLFIAEVDGVPVGSGRLDFFCGDGAEIHLTVAPAHRLRGYGGQIIDALLDVARATGTRTVIAVVRGANIPSLRAFLSNEFAPRGMLTLSRTLEGEGR